VTFLISFSIPSFSSKLPMSVAKINVNTKYIAVILKPKNFRNKIMIIGFRTGEAIKNEMVPPKGAPLLNSPTRIGIVEHEQKGVMAPRAAPMTFCNLL